VLHLIAWHKPQIGRVSWTGSSTCQRRDRSIPHIPHIVVDVRLWKLSALAVNCVCRRHCCVEFGSEEALDNSTLLGCAHTCPT
jgi:hypothetical protein